MIDTDKYKIADDVVWVWNDHPDDEGWVLWEYKECSEEGGGYPGGSDPNKTYEPHHQVLPSLIFECKIDERMDAITDLPLILAEVKRLRKELEHIQNDMAWTVQVWQNENYMGRQDWMEQMCEIYTDLAKGIEAQYHGEEEE